MLRAGVVEHKVQIDFDTLVVGLRNEAVEVCSSTKFGVHGIIVLHIITMILG